MHRFVYLKISHLIAHVMAGVMRRIMLLSIYSETEII